MNKRILQAPTELYQKMPTWLVAILTPVMVEGFFIIGSVLFGIIFGLAAVFFIIANGNFDAFTEGMTLPLHVELLSFSFVSGLLFIWVKWVEKRSISSLGFFKKNWFKELALGFLVGSLQFSLAIGLVYLLGGVRFSGVDFSGLAWLYVLSTIPFWLLQGGTEELLTRGWLLPILNKRTNLAIAVGISSSLFGLMHLANNHITFLSILNIVLFGIAMALYMLKRDNLWGVIGIHGAWNFVQGNVYGVAVSGQSVGASLFHFVEKAGAPEWISGGGFGTEGSLITSLVELLLIVYLYYGIKKEKA
ncbi:CPBP family intramembrane glutamic endopeptidase [Streptococcus hillyeri]|uniref:CPBP family intramembrane metalloprotease n=2 Tax=Streptococcus hillyeri TaxID=2282420 RepID=A0A3L9DWY5_9STRE|nr:type II CAAX endopeptidase family protein [Streptococcus hillyeri]RLY04788.1 CPBP family intramembrane metalloprotease [Streptococcus hillyeri]